MKKYFTLFLSVAIFCPFVMKAYSGIWQPLTGNVPTKGKQLLHPDKSLSYFLRSAYLQGVLSSVSDDPEQGTIIELPSPDGSFRSFKVWQSHLMQDGLAARYPDIKTFTAYEVNNPSVTAKLDYTPRGFHAMVFDGDNTYFIDPYSDQNDAYYLCYYKRDYSRAAYQKMSCQVTNNETSGAGQRIEINNSNSSPSNEALKVLNGNYLHTYRLALACTGEYAVAVAGASPTKAAVLSAMVTSVNRVVGVYERDLAISMQLVNNDDTLICLSSVDPYDNNNGRNMLGQNQAHVDSLIGPANYDIGHVFSTGGGGIAQLKSVCKPAVKAEGVTGYPTPIGDAFDIDYVAHEMGHQFGANHSFNDNYSGSCGRNAAQDEAYEPGGGSTIMAYAGICAPDDLQAHSDAYFHAISLKEITTYINDTGGTCAVITPTSNKPVAIPAFSHNYYIPYKTPFELTAPAVTDSTPATTANTFCWEQWNLGDFGATLSNTFLYGPIFRSFSPDTSHTRIFPTVNKLLANVISYQGEKLADTGRYLTFKFTVRNVNNGIGCVHISDDSIRLDAVNTGVPFTLTSPVSATIWPGNSTQTVSWVVASTDVAPISCGYVDIYLSADGGYTWPYLLQSHVPNTGSATVTIPRINATDSGRIKVKGSGNVFFNINEGNFNITDPTGVPQLTSLTSAIDVAVYPVPAADALHIDLKNKSSLQAAIRNTLGQTIWKGDINTSKVLSVASWPKGIYYIELADKTNGQRTVKSIVIQ